MFRLFFPTLQIVFFLFVAFLYSCSGKTKDDSIVFKLLDESLVNSNLILTYENNEKLFALQEKLKDPGSHERASIWEPKAKLVQKYSFDLVSFLDSLKVEIRKESGILNDIKEPYSHDDLRTTSQLFEKNGMKIYKRLKNYQQDVLQIDTLIRRDFTNDISFLALLKSTHENKQEDFNKIYFNRLSPLAALAMLSQFQNKVKIIENKILQYCFENSVTSKDIIYVFWPIITQSSTYVKGGQQIKITAGVGSFSKRAAPIITIKGKNVVVDHNGIAHYYFKTSLKRGKHIVPVRVDFTDEIGMKKSISKDVEYTVAK